MSEDLKQRFIRLKTDMAVLKAMAGVNLAATLAVLVRVFLH